MHALRWTRQQSIDQLLGAGLTETDAVIETDRYIGWPAQALTYKVGQREIERLRREISARDGDAFDLREFHDQLLGHGSLPLATLAPSSRTGWPRPSEPGASAPTPATTSPRGCDAGLTAPPIRASRSTPRADHPATATRRVRSTRALEEARSWSQVNRRTFLKGAAATAGVAALQRPVPGLRRACQRR